MWPPAKRVTAVSGSLLEILALLLPFCPISAASATNAAWPIYLHSHPDILVCNSACDLQLAPSVAAMINFNFGNHIQHQTAKRGMLVPGPMQRDNLQVVVKVERMPGGHVAAAS